MDTEKYDIILFGGTTEGRKLAYELAKCGVRQYICTASAEGAAALGKVPGAYISSRALSTEAIKQLISRTGAKYIADATHPYAAEISRNIKKAANGDIKIIRVLRKGCEGNISSRHKIFKNISEMVQYLNENDGNALSTLGSKASAELTGIKEYKSRIFIRVLDSDESVNKAVSEGFPISNIIAKNPPFFKEENISLIKKHNIKYMLTKDSGTEGGFEEKDKACRETGIELLVADRPVNENGVSVEEAAAFLKRELCQKVYILGAGPANAELMSVKAAKILKKAQAVCGSERALENITDMLSGKKIFPSYKADEIAGFARENGDSKIIAVVVTGDSGFFSGAKKIAEALDFCYTEFVPGISSLSYFCGVFGIPQQDIKVLSLHGRDAYFINAADRNKRVFMLLDGKNTVKHIASELVRCGMGDVRLYIGSRLSYDNEETACGKAWEFTERDFKEPAVLLTENDGYCAELQIGMDDRRFIRDDIPMTKSSVRAAVMAAMSPGENDICVDIGCGTGSVSVELSGFCKKVIAVDKNPEACALTEENAVKFRRQNIEVINGGALESLQKTEHFDKVFIGGAGNEIGDVIKYIFEANPKASVTVTAVTLETLEKTRSAFAGCGILPEVRCIAVSRGERAGNYTMMRSENPVYIIKGAFE